MGEYSNLQVGDKVIVYDKYNNKKIGVVKRVTKTCNYSAVGADESSNLK